MTDRKVFVEPVMRGARYEEHSVPVDALVELATYSEIIVAIARALFFSNHPSRKRVPRNFAERLGLTLREVRPGSAIPVLVRQKDGDDADAYFDRARDLFNAAIADLMQRDQLPNGFPRELIPLVTRLGKELLPGESIEFRPPHAADAPRFDHTARQRFIRLASAKYEQAIHIAGFVEAVDVKEQAEIFRVRSEEHGDIEVPLQPWFEELAVAFMKNRHQWRIEIDGVGEFSETGRLLRIVRVNSVDFGNTQEIEADVAKLNARLTELERLQPGWLDGEGEKIAAPALDMLRGLIEAHAEGASPRFYVFPTPEGGARAEWRMSDWDASAESDPSGLIEAHALNLVSGEERVRQCKFADDVVEFVASLGTVQ